MLRSISWMVSAVLLLSGCVTQIDPLIGNAAATLPGSEFGPPAALVADLQAAEKAAARLATVLERAGPTAAQQSALAAGPAVALRMRLLAGDITQRLTAMEEVRRRSNYVAEVEKQQRLTQTMVDARAEAVWLQRRVNYELAWGQAMANMSRGTVTEIGRVNNGNGTETVRYRVNTGMGPHNTEAVGRAEAALSEGQEEAERLRRLMAAPGLEQFERAKTFIAQQSRQISDRLWPELRRATADLERLTATP